MDKKAFDRFFGARVADTRHRSTLTQGELAARVGIARTTLTNIESGKQGVPLYQAFRIAAELGVDLGSLLPNLKPPHLGIEASLARLPADAREWAARVIGEGNAD